jgi:drug/metabolite transporter superfamily protein YnfA
VTMLITLLLAAVLELGGDAAIRRGLLRPAWPWLVLGSLMLVAYGFMVNATRAIDFGRLMGLYIALFFVVSQALSIAMFRERPSLNLVLGGALIVAGGAVIQLGTK